MIPWRTERLPTPVFWPGEFHGLYSPWGCKEPDTTERFSLSLFIQRQVLVSAEKGKQTEKYQGGDDLKMEAETGVRRLHSKKSQDHQQPLGAETEAWID